MMFKTKIFRAALVFFVGVSISWAENQVPRTSASQEMTDSPGLASHVRSSLDQASGEVPWQEKRFFTRVDYWSAGKIFHNEEGRLQQRILNLYQAGPGNFSGTAQYANGYGVRFGALFPVIDDRFDWGWSLGYAKTPRGSFVLFKRYSTITSMTEAYNHQAQIFRALSEYVIHQPLVGGVGVRLGAAIGYDSGHLKKEIHTYGTGSLASTTGSSTVTGKWTGISWEISPGIVFSWGRFKAEIGASYTSFSTKKVEEDLGTFDFTMPGFFARAEF
jgi:hypothetical protein